MTRKAIVMWFVCAFAVACATNPATGRRQFNTLSEADEVRIGKESDAQVRREMGVYGDQALQEYVSRVGLAMAKKSHRPALPWHFTVVDAPAVNAFALPGGYIYVTRGILPFLRDEAELAGVIGHEIAHVTARHGAQAYSKQQIFGLGLGVAAILAPPNRRGVVEAVNVSLGLLFLKHGRDAELEADRLGVGYASAGGWDPGAMTGVLGTLGRLDEAAGSRRGVPNFLTTHPLPADRVERVKGSVEAARAAGGRATNAPDFARRLDGLVWGDSREQGIVRGTEFLHPILGLALKFPQGWTVANSAEQVSAVRDEQGSVGMVLQAAAAGTPEQAARALTTTDGLTEVSGGRTTINGLPAYVGAYAGVSSGQRLGVRAAHVALGSSMYLVAGIAPESAFGQADNAFQGSINTFRGLSRQEADRIQPSRVDFYVVRAGETWASIAKSVSDGQLTATALAIMNGASPSTPPRAGDRIRVVVGG